VRDLSAPPPNYVPIGFETGGFRWLRPWSQLIRLQNGQIAPGSPNGIHAGVNGNVYLGGVPSPNFSRVLQTGLSAPSATSNLQMDGSGGVQTSLPLAASPGLSARPTVIGPQ
jgi:hypothetical protein